MGWLNTLFRRDKADRRAEQLATTLEGMVDDPAALEPVDASVLPLPRARVDRLLLSEIVRLESGNRGSPEARRLAACYIMMARFQEGVAATYIDALNGLSTEDWRQSLATHEQWQAEFAARIAREMDERRASLVGLGYVDLV